MEMNLVACVLKSLQLYRCSIAIWFNVVVCVLAVDKRLIAVLPLHPKSISGRLPMLIPLPVIFRMMKIDKNSLILVVLIAINLQDTYNYGVLNTFTAY
jgi:hypothetical protein